MVFSDHVMKQRLPDKTYDALHKTIEDGTRLDSSVGAVVAEAMKDWAVELGATHYTHWFQPMTGITAEKHNSFIKPTGDGRAIMEFSSEALVQGETDASSLPSGGLRATFEARGYTAWDPTSYAFVRGETLYIPTAFCSYGGHALDEKTPLLRSMHAISKQAMRILKLFGNADITSVTPMAGAEQEYFLIDKAMFEKRKDLMYSGRTLLGSKPPKGQQLDDQYYGAIKPRVSDYMKDLNEELWKLGVPAMTEHNESAPAQHELASMYTTTNIATDHNQLIMEIMQSIAKEHGMICVLHEKPFDGINGSGKHNNWSLATSKGVNLLDPGATPHENAQFLLFLIAVIKAVDEYQDLLRISAASAGNDNRLGGYEAPPAILSVYLGDEINAILEAIENEDESLPSYDGKKDMMLIGETALPPFPKDTTDRNRTSPFAFTGDKFEFRMVGSDMSIAQANVVINTAVAESLRVFANELESAKDFNTALHKLIKKTITAHKRIIFNGDGYGDKWVQEAKSRGLLNLKTTPDALPHILNNKNVKLYEEHKVFSREELCARLEISLENYCNLLSIEAMTMYKLIKKSIINVAVNYAHELSRAALAKKKLVPDADCVYETQTVTRLSDITAGLHYKSQKLYMEMETATETEDAHDRAMYIKDNILPTMEEIRELADELELIIPRKDWPFPTYGDLLFSVR
jgi:glutamine synthetase